MLQLLLIMDFPVIDLSSETNEVTNETFNQYNYRVLYDIPFYQTDVEKFANGLITDNVSVY